MGHIRNPDKFLEFWVGQVQSGQKDEISVRTKGAFLGSGLPYHCPGSSSTALPSRPSPACISAHTDIPPDFCPHSNFKPSASLALAPFSFKFSLPFSVSLQLHRTRFQLWLQSGFATLVIRSSSSSPLLQPFTCYFWHLPSLTLIYGTTRWTPESSVHTRFMINFWFNDKGWSRNGVLPPKTSPCTYKSFFLTRLWRPVFW